MSNANVETGKWAFRNWHLMLVYLAVAGISASAFILAEPLGAQLYLVGLCWFLFHFVLIGCRLHPKGHMWCLAVWAPAMVIGSVLGYQDYSVEETARLTTLHCEEAAAYARATPGQTVVPDDLLARCSPLLEKAAQAKMERAAAVVNKLQENLAK